MVILFSIFLIIHYNLSWWVLVGMIISLSMDVSE